MVLIPTSLCGCIINYYKIAKVISLIFIHIYIHMYW